MNEFAPQHPDRQPESAMKDPHYTVYSERRRDGSPMRVTEFATADPEQPSYLLTVKRSDDELDEGWLLGGIVGTRDGLRARVVKLDAAGDSAELSKYVSVDALIEQNGVLSEEYLEQRYGVSLAEMQRIAAENDHDRDHDREVSPVVQQEVGSSALKAVGVEAPAGLAVTTPEIAVETPVEVMEAQPEAVGEIAAKAPSPERVLTDEQKPKAASVPEFIDRTPWSKEESLPVVEEQQDPYEARLRLLSAKPQPQGRDRFGNNLDGRLETTPQSLEDAALAYRFASDEVKEIIQEYTTDDIWGESDMYQLVKDNDELRFRIMRHLVDHLDDISHRLPDRLRRNTEKTINYQGYQKMTSREAAAVLALEMLGGTYKRTTDGIHISKYSEVEQGQHRWAAMCALGLEQSPYAQEVMKLEREW